MENPIKMDDLGGNPLFLETHISASTKKHTKHHLHRIHSCLHFPPQQAPPPEARWSHHSCCVTSWVATCNLDDEGNDFEDGTWYQSITLQRIHVSHLGKRKIIFKSALVGDMLVPWRVHSWKLTAGT